MLSLPVMMALRAPVAYPKTTQTMNRYMIVCSSRQSAAQGVIIAILFATYVIVTRSRAVYYSLRAVDLSVSVLDYFKMKLQCELGTFVGSYQRGESDYCQDDAFFWRPCPSLRRPGATVTGFLEALGCAKLSRDTS